eukprot:2083370-Rhodomonas_salina.1
MRQEGYSSSGLRIQTDSSKSACSKPCSRSQQARVKWSARLDAGTPYKGSSSSKTTSGSSS